SKNSRLKKSTQRRTKKYSKTPKLNIQFSKKPIKYTSRKTKKNYSPKKSKSTKTQKLIRRLLPKLIILGLILILLGGIFSVIAFAWYSKDLPDPNKIIDRSIIQSTKIYDRTGEHLLYDIHGDQQRTLIDINNLPEYVVNATIAIEDRTFYEHKGISVWGIIRGQIMPRLQGKRIQGGSTITQQFIKNAVLTNKRSLSRKIKEWILSYQIEQKYSKQEILKMYFNEIPYGSVAYGIESAANIYFDKHAQDLSIAESAILAALPKAPTYYSPYGPNRDKLILRQQTILNLMLEQKLISPEEHTSAKAEELIFKKAKNNIRAPHFVFYVKEILSATLGERMIEQGGLKVITTLDYKKQEAAEKIITEKTENYPEKWNANNAALLTLDVKTGDILAMLGSRDFFNDEIDGQVNVVLASRQPGSSIKPFIYTLGFEKGYQPETILFDVETTFKTDIGNYNPLNYDLETHGPISLRQALAGSLNIPAVKLMYLVKIPDTLDFLKKFGYSTIKDASNYGLSLVLGGLEVRMIEHLNAFTTLARGGIKKPTQAILKVEDSSGKIIYEADNEKGKRVIEEDAVRKTNKSLSDNSARSFIFGENNYLTLGNKPATAKTGTTNDFNDAWTIGFTPHVATAVWIGNNDNQKMKTGAAGGAIAAPIWNAYMREITKDYPADGFADYQRETIDRPMLSGNISQEIKVKIEKETNLLAGEYTPPSMIIEKTFRKVHNILHYINSYDPLGPSPENPGDDPNYNSWEEAVLKWAIEEEVDTSDPPTEYEQKYLLQNQPELTINYPNKNQNIPSENINFQIETKAKDGFYIDRVVYKIDGRFIGSTRNEPYNYQYKFNSGIKNGEHELNVLVFDDQENYQQKNITFKLNIERTNNHNINWETPSNNDVIKQDDFPLNLQVEIDNISTVNKIDFYYINEDTNQSNWIQIISKPLDSNINIEWTDSPAIGNYTLFSIITDKQNNTHQESGISIIIE
ncbi:penicillin-binding protein, partial [bacterium]|nr:penicillin-binding protein [bacterium]